MGRTTQVRAFVTPGECRQPIAAEPTPPFSALARLLSASSSVLRDVAMFMRMWFCAAGAVRRALVHVHLGGLDEVALDHLLRRQRLASARLGSCWLRPPAASR